jgi:HTH-type transcriptional regulator, global nitrogen regulator NrpRI
LNIVEINPKLKVAILRFLRDSSHPVGSSIITTELQAFGFDLSPRTVRLYLEEMERDGLVKNAKRGRSGGREITSQGINEIHDANVNFRIGFMAAKVDDLSYQVNFDPNKGSGLIVMNISIIDRVNLPAAVRHMIPVFEANVGMGRLAYLTHEGEMLGEFIIPPGKVGIGTVCSVTLNGILLSARIPTVSLFGGVLEMDKGNPTRFTDVIYYNGTSLDPLEIFIKGKLTSVREVARSGHGRIGASFREIPSSAISKVKSIRKQLDQMGLGGILLLGKPNQSLLEFPVEEGRTGIIVAGGLNPTSAIEEAGIPTEHRALSSLIEYQKLFHFKELAARVEREEY